MSSCQRKKRCGQEGRIYQSEAAVKHNPPFVCEHGAAYASQQHNKSTWGNPAVWLKQPVILCTEQSVSHSSVSCCGTRTHRLTSVLFHFQQSFISVDRFGFYYCFFNILTFHFSTGLSNILLRRVTRLPLQKSWTIREQSRSPTLMFVGRKKKKSSSKSNRKT